MNLSSLLKSANVSLLVCAPNAQGKLPFSASVVNTAVRSARSISGLGDDRVHEKRVHTISVALCGIDRRDILADVQQRPASLHTHAQTSPSREPCVESLERRMLRNCPGIGKNSFVERQFQG